ncbi:MAG: translation initiation factor IF-3 [Candidatus Jorgensenbacteria bacterium]
MLIVINYRINKEISARELRVIDEKGNSLGVLKTEEALRLAEEKELDLIEVAPHAKPPVAKIISFDKFRYQKEKEEKKQRLGEKRKELKQIRVTPRAAINDLQIKARKADEFLKEGHKVELNLFLRGREKANKSWGLEKLGDFLKLIRVPYKVTMEPKWGGKGFIMQIDAK